MHHNFHFAEQLTHLYSIERFRKGLFPLFFNRVILSIANALIGIFVPIFLFVEFNNSISLVLSFFLVHYCLFALAVPMGAIIMSKIGLKKAMIFSSLFNVSTYIGLYCLTSTKNLLFLIPILLSWNLFRALYWTPYHTSFAEFTDQKHRGIEVAFFLGTISFIELVLPAASGYFIDNHGFLILYGIVSCVIFLSIIPLLFMKEIYETYSFGYIESFQKLFSKKWRTLIIPYASDGAETVVGHIVWPIFIFILLHGQYTAVGIISSLVGLTVIITRFFAGQLSDKFSKRDLIKYSNIFYAFGWMLKIFVETFFQIFIVNTYHKIVFVMRQTPFAALRYEQAAHEGSLIDEYNVMREVSINIGRIISILCLLVAVQFLPLSSAFILAAIFSFFITLL